MNPIPPLKTWLVAAVLVAIASGNAQARSHEAGAQAPNSIARTSMSAVGGSPHADEPHADFSSLVDAAASHALGEVWGRPVQDPRTRQLVAISAFLAQGNMEYLKALTAHAFELGVTEEQLRELAYLTLARAGSAHGVDAGEVVKALFSVSRSCRLLQ